MSNLENFRKEILDFNELINETKESENRKPLLDGPLNIEKYFNAKIKIVWLLKEGYEEKNGDGGGWNYSEDVGLFPEKYILTRDFY